ncbi:MAG: YlxR family protein [Firmicutes bacterium]|nr:YlxR family protein [Bacillota bacterium]
MKDQSKERICCVCRKKDLASTRIRVARIDGQFIVDKVGNANGRGAYVCIPCVPEAVKRKAFNRSFKSPVPQEVYDSLLASCSYQ